MNQEPDYADGRYDTSTAGKDFVHDTEFMKPENYVKGALKLGGFPARADNAFKEAFHNVPDHPRVNPIVIRPSLQLATKILYFAPRATTFLHTLLGDLRLGQPGYARNYTVFQHPEKRWIQGVEIFADEWDPDRDVTKQDRQAMLLYVRKMMIWGVHRYTFDSNAETTYTEQVVTGREYPEAIQNDPKFRLNGWESVTHIPRKMYDDLAAATAQNPPDIPLLLWLRFRLATTVLRELMHAARNCLAGAHEMQPFFGHNPMAELGLELESWVFDGVIDVIYEDTDLEDMALYTHGGVESDLQGVLVMWEYPARSLLAKYKDSATYRDDGTEMKPLDVAWRVPIRFLQQLFQTQFWNDMLSVEATDGQPDRRVGYCFRTQKVGRDQVELIPVIVPTAAAKYLPENYACNEDTGDILPTTRLFTEDVAKTRLLQNAMSMEERTWINPYEEGGEYEHITGLERRRREILYRLGEDLSPVQPRGKYEHSDRSEMGGTFELLSGLVLDGMMRLPRTTPVFQPHTRDGALQYLKTLTRATRTELADIIAENNFKLRSEGQLITTVQGADTEPEQAVSRADRIHFTGMSRRYPVEQSASNYLSQNTLNIVDDITGWYWNTTTGRPQPYFTTLANSPVVPLPMQPQGRIRVSDLPVHPSAQMQRIRTIPQGRIRYTGPLGREVRPLPIFTREDLRDLPARAQGQYQRSAMGPRRPPLVRPSNLIRRVERSRPRRGADAVVVSSDEEDAMDQS